MMDYYRDKTPEAVEQLRAIATRVNDRQSRIATDIVENGLDLIETKGMLPHGEWLEWLDAETQMSERTARNYMSVARAFPKSATVADLNISQRVLYALSAPSVSDETREEWVERIQKGEKPSVDMIQGNEVDDEIENSREGANDGNGLPDTPNDVADGGDTNPVSGASDSQGSGGDLGEPKPSPKPPQTPAPPKTYDVPEDFNPLTKLEGYRNSDHSKAFEVIQTVCENRGVAVTDVVAGFCEYWPEGQVRHGWSDPVASLRNDRVLSIEIKKVLEKQRGGTGRTQCPTCGSYVDAERLGIKVTVSSSDNLDKYREQAAKL